MEGFKQSIECYMDLAKPFELSIEPGPLGGKRIGLKHADLYVWRTLMRKELQECVDDLVGYTITCLKTEMLEAIESKKQREATTESKKQREATTLIEYFLYMQPYELEISTRYFGPVSEPEMTIVVHDPSNWESANNWRVMIRLKASDIIDAKNAGKDLIMLELGYLKDMMNARRAKK